MYPSNQLDRPSTTMDMTTSTQMMSTVVFNMPKSNVIGWPIAHPAMTANGTTKSATSVLCFFNCLCFQIVFVVVFPLFSFLLFFVFSLSLSRGFLKQRRPMLFRMICINFCVGLPMF